MPQSHPLLDIPSVQIETARNILNSFSGKRILIAGDLMLDEYLIGDVRRISPEAPVPVVEITHRTHLPGGASNVASNVASLGGEPILLGIVGSDGEAECLKAVLRSRRVSAAAMVTATDRPTTTKTRIVSGQQQIVRIDREDKKPISEDLEDKVVAVFSDALSDADACILSDYAKGMLTPSVCRRMIACAREQGKPLVVDPKGTDFSKYAGCTVMTPNLREAEVATNLMIQDDPALFIAAERLRTILGAGTALLVTRGADGMTLFASDRTSVHMPAMVREVFDVTGAGDTVAGTLTIALACGAAIADAMFLSNLAASIVVQKVGTATVSVDELANVLHGAESATTDRPMMGRNARSYVALAYQAQLM